MDPVDALVCAPQAALGVRLAEHALPVEAPSKDAAPAGQGAKNDACLRIEVPVRVMFLTTIDASHSQE